MDDLVFRLLNQPSQFQSDVNRLQSIRKEAVSLRKFLDVQTNDQLMDTITHLCTRRDKEIERRKRQVDELIAQKQCLEAEAEKLGIFASTSGTSKQSFDLSAIACEIKEFKANLLKWRGEIERKMNDAKTSIETVLKSVYDDAVIHINEGREQVLLLENEREKLANEEEIAKRELSELEEASANIRIPLEIDDSLEEAEAQRTHFIETTQHILNEAEKRLTRDISGPLLMQINLAIDNFQVTVDRISTKIEKFTRIVKFRKLSSGKAAQTAAKDQAIENFRTLLRISRRCGNIQSVIRNAESMYRQETALIQQGIDNAERIAGDSNMTMSALRREIVRLERRIFEENFYGERDCEAMEAKRVMYMNATQEEIARSKK